MLPFCKCFFFHFTYCRYIKDTYIKCNLNLLFLAYRISLYIILFYLRLDMDKPEISNITIIQCCVKIGRSSLIERKYRLISKFWPTKYINEAAELSVNAVQHMYCLTWINKITFLFFRVHSFSLHSFYPSPCKYLLCFCLGMWFLMMAINALVAQRHFKSSIRV